MCVCVCVCVSTVDITQCMGKSPWLYFFLLTDNCVAYTHLEPHDFQKVSILNTEGLIKLLSYYILHITVPNVFRFFYNPGARGFDVRSDDILYHSAGGMLLVGTMIFMGCTIVLRKKNSASNFWADCPQAFEKKILCSVLVPGGCYFLAVWRMDEEGYLYFCDCQVTPSSGRAKTLPQLRWSPS